MDNQLRHRRNNDGVTIVQTDEVAPADTACGRLVRSFLRTRTRYVVPVVTIAAVAFVIYYVHRKYASSADNAKQNKLEADCTIPSNSVENAELMEIKTENSITKND